MSKELEIHLFKISGMFFFQQFIEVLNNTNNLTIGMSELFAFTNRTEVIGVYCLNIWLVSLLANILNIRAFIFRI